MPVTRPSTYLAATGLALAALPMATAAHAAPQPCTLLVEPTAAAAGITADDHVSPNATGVVVITAPPSSVQNLAVTAEETSATVSWTPPTSNGNLALTRYDLTLGNAAGLVGEYSAPATATSCVLNGLTSNTTYTVTIAARNVAGLGPATLQPFATKVAITPAAPLTPPATPGNPTTGPSETPGSKTTPRVKKAKAKKPKVRLSAGKHRRDHTLTVRWRAKHVSKVQLTWQRGKGKPHSQHPSPSGRITLAGPVGTRYTITAKAGKAHAQRTYSIR